MENDSKGKKFNLLKASFFLSLTMLGLKVASFFRDMLLANYFGATIESDVFLASSTVLMIFASIITSPIAASFLPVATDIYLQKDKNKFNTFIGSAYAGGLVVGIILTIIQLLFLNQIIAIVTPGFSSEDARLLYSLIVIQLPVITISMLKGINTGNLQITNNFSSGQVLNSLGVISIIIYLLTVKSNSSIYGAALFFTIGNFISLIIGLYITRKNGVKPKLNTNFITPEFNVMLRMMLIFAIASGVREINLVIDKAIGSLLPVGSITMMSYASKMTVTEVGLISVAISTVAYAQIAKLSSQNNKSEIKKTFVNAINIVNVLIFPLTILTIVLRYDIIRVLFGRGEFSQSNIMQTSNIMMFYAIGMIGFGMQDVITRTFHALKITKYTVMSSAMIVAINVSMSLMLYRPYGVYGVAFASSISVLIVIVPLFIVCNRYVIPLKGEGIIKETIKIAAATLVCGLTAYTLNNMHINNTGLLFKLVSISCISIICYIATGYILQVTVIKDIVTSFIKRIISVVRK